MRTSILSCLPAAAPVAAILSIALASGRATAMPAVTPIKLGITTDTGLVQMADWQGWRHDDWTPERRYWGWPAVEFAVRPWGYVPWGWHHGWHRHHWRHW
jgi:hypothetical protein